MNVWTKKELEVHAEHVRLLHFHYDDIAREPDWLENNSNRHWATSFKGLMYWCYLTNKCEECVTLYNRCEEWNGTGLPLSDEDFSKCVEYINQFLETCRLLYGWEQIYHLSIKLGGYYD